MDEEAKVLSTRQIGFELKAANNMIRRKMDSIFAQQDGSELIGMQRPLLGYLYHKSRHGDVYQKDVEKEFRIRRSTATVMLQSMEQKGYVVRVASTEDGRLKRILLTEKAIEHHHVIEEQILNFNRELEAGLTEEEKAEQLKLRGEYINAYKQSLIAQLENTYILEPDGTKRKVRRKDDAAPLN